MSFLDLSFLYLFWFGCEDEPKPEYELVFHLTIKIDTEEHLADEKPPHKSNRRVKPQH